MKIEFQFETDKIVDLCKRIKQAGGNLTTPLNQFGTYYLRQIDATFIQQGAREGHPAWQPLSMMTLAMRRKGKSSGSPMILQDSGYLRQHFSYNLLGNTGVEVGTAVPYAIKHQLGDVIPAHQENVKEHQRKKNTSARHSLYNTILVHAFTRQAPERKIPIRQMIFLTGNDEQRIPSIFAEYLEKVIQGGTV